MKRERSNLSWLVLLILTFAVGSAITMFVPTTLFAQDQAPDRGAKVGNSYQISDFETINTTNGNLMFNFQLGSLPQGRGQLGGGISLIYNSKLWDLHNSKIKDYRHECTWEIEGYEHCTYYTKVDLTQSDKGGWTYNTFGYRLEVEDRRNEYGGDPPSCNGGVTNENWQTLTYIWKVRLVFPDGSTHEMVPLGYSAVMGDGFYRVDPNGIVQDCGSMPTQAARPVYYSTDGTFMRMEPSGTSDWTVYFPDGRKLMNFSRMYDKNGNYIDGQSADSLGRTVFVRVNSNGDDEVVSKGVDGEEVVWTVKWKQIYVKKYYLACPAGPGVCPDEDQVGILNIPQRVVDKIIQPSQLGGGEYTFSYNAPTSFPSTVSDGFGEVSGVTLPSGATIQYSYLMDNLGIQQDPSSTDDILNNYPTGKSLTYNREYDSTSTPTTENWQFSHFMSSGSTVDPSGVVTSNSAYDSPAWMKGMTYMTVASNGPMVERNWEADQVVSGGPMVNPQVTVEFTSIRDASGAYSLTTIKEYKHDKNGNTTEVREYDWMPYSSVHPNGQGQPVVPSNASSYLKRITKTDYYHDTPDASSSSLSDPDIYAQTSAPRLLNLAKSVEVQDASGTPKSRSEITYDYIDYNSSNTVAGNVTQTKTWDSFKGGQTRAYSNPLTGTNSITTSATYNGYGMPLTTTDANGNVTQITYGNIAGPNGNVSDLYPTQTVAAYGTAQARTSTATYDFYTGAVLTTTDADNGVTNAVEYDDLGRPVKAITAQGTALESWTQTEYHDADRFVVVRSDLETKGDGKKVATQFYDQLGRVRLSKTLEDSATQSATNETDGIKVQTRYLTDYNSQSGVGHTYQLTSNPYRAATASAAAAESTMGWTLSTALNTGKHSEVETFSGSALPSVFGGNNTASTGIVQTDIDANATTVTDQAGKLRRSITNGLGQLIRVDEPNDSNQLGTVASPNQATSYAYDTLNNLTTVSQGVQTRTFTYSSLSRLLSASNPESGTISYGYDSNGNLTSKTDARSIVTTYTYDALGRVLTRSYSDSTPSVAYTYGTSAPKIGKLIKVQSSVSTTEYTDFDILGRVTGHKQTTDGQDYATSYTYTLAGALDTETYPSGRVVKNVLDNNGDLETVQSKKNANFGFFDYAKNFTYNPAGAVTSLQLGNGHWESTVFNSRLQPTEISLGVTPTATDLLKLDYSYGTTANNGNVQTQTITVPTVGQNTGFVAVQTYQYDSLNRLKDATENVTPTGGSATQSWRQAFTYDRYGNRNFDEANTTTLQKNCGTTPNLTVCQAEIPVVNPSVNASNNRLVGYTFDSAGNTTGDAQGRTFVYDAENQQIAVSAGNGLIGQYYYDGDGKRVKKYIPSTGEVTVFVYDASGRSVAEYSTIVASSQDAKVSYLTADHLASPRINTDQNGAVIARHDYHPFGEEIDGSGGRTTDLNYGDDSVRKQFTSYEHDGETELEFAEARYYSHSLGRFSSVDPLMSDSSDIELPQSWNLYAYVVNRPTNLTDFTGLIWVEDLRKPGGPTWIPDDEWKNMSDDTKVFYKIWTQMEYPSQKGQIRLDPNGPSAANPSGWSIIGPAVSQSNIVLGTTVVISQVDGPEFGPFDIVALAYLCSVWGQNQLLNIPKAVPHHSTLLNKSTEDNKDSDSGKGNSKSSESLSPKVKSKLGGLADRAEETVAQVIRSRGGTASVVGQAGPWAGKTMAETAAAAVAGDKSAETAIKCAKQAGRLGQKH